MHKKLEQAATAPLKKQGSPVGDIFQTQGQGQNKTSISLVKRIRRILQGTPNATVNMGKQPLKSPVETKHDLFPDEPSIKPDKVSKPDSATLIDSTASKLRAIEPISSNTNNSASLNNTELEKPSLASSSQPKKTAQVVKKVAEKAPELTQTLLYAPSVKSSGLIFQLADWTKMLKVSKRLGLRIHRLSDKEENLKLKGDVSLSSQSMRYSSAPWRAKEDTVQNVANASTTGAHSCAPVVISGEGEEEGTVGHWNPAYTSFHRVPARTEPESKIEERRRKRAEKQNRKAEAERQDIQTVAETNIQNYTQQGRPVSALITGGKNDDSDSKELKDLIVSIMQKNGVAPSIIWGKRGFSSTALILDNIKRKVYWYTPGITTLQELGEGIEIVDIQPWDSVRTVDKQKYSASAVNAFMKSRSRVKD